MTITYDRRAAARNADLASRAYLTASMREAATKAANRANMRLAIYAGLIIGVLGAVVNVCI